MQVFQGLMSHQVLQRSSRNVNETFLSIQSTVAGLLQLRVTKNNRAMCGLNFKNIGKVNRGISNIKLTGIPIGGPYEVVLRIIGTDGKVHKQILFNNILVGDVWILAGQSNMQGRGLLKDAAKPVSMVRAFCMDDRWLIAKDPIHNLWDAVDQVHTDINGGEPVYRSKYIGTGPGISFGQEMLKQTCVPQGIISCAHGGTTMRQWAPSLKKLGGKSLYGAMLRRFYKNGSNVAGILWYQGEADTLKDEYKLYTRRMKKLVASIRSDFSMPKLPFIMAQLSRHYVVETPRGKDYWNSVQEQQRLLPNVIERLMVVPTVDLGLDDSIHISGTSQQRLGKRLSNAACALINGRKAGKLPIQLKSIKLIANRYNDCVDIEITLVNVIEKLQSMGRPNGFTLVKPNGTICDAIYRIDIKGNKVILRTELLVGEKYKLNLHYGYGFSPYCNITDKADRSLPVFGCDTQKLKC